MSQYLIFMEYPGSSDNGNAKPSARLENWYVGGDDLLFGEVYSHPDIKDGEKVVTSRVVRWDKENNIAYTRNTEYILGKPVTALEE